jgi:hypothetical protein
VAQSAVQPADFEHPLDHRQFLREHQTLLHQVLSHGPAAVAGAHDPKGTIGIHTCRQKGTEFLQPFCAAAVQSC